MITCAINLSEGRDRAVLEGLASAAAGSLLDLHADPWHHRCVLTLGGPDTEGAARRVARRAVELIDLRRHLGVHPRLGVVDVVPFTPFPPYGADLEPAGLDEARSARDRFVAFAAGELDLPCYTYGAERQLPELRRLVRCGLAPDAGPSIIDPARGACCVGARPPLVAYNLILAELDLGLARRIAAAVRSPQVRALGLQTGEEVQVSCNLVAPHLVGPAALFDAVGTMAPLRRAELVGLIPARLLDAVPAGRWSELDLSPDRTLEHRVAAAAKPGPAGATLAAPRW